MGNRIQELENEVDEMESGNTEIADLRREVEHLKSEIELITAPPEAVGNVILDLRRQLEECRSRYAVKAVAAENDASVLMGEIERLKTALAGINAEWIDRCRRFRKQDADEYESQLAELREAIWLNHGCQGLYGDDGEMQCSKCMIDFKRDSLEKILSVLPKMREQLAEVTAERDQWKVDAKQLQSTLRVVEDENAEVRVANNSLRAELDGLRLAATKVDKQDWNVALLSSDQCEALDYLTAALRREE